MTDRPMITSTKIELGAAVRSADGQEVGAVDRLIVDPDHGNVTAAVIRTGSLLPHDVEIPLTAMTVDGPEDVRLAYTADHLDDLPEFCESTHTITPPAGYVVPLLAYPAGALYWPATFGYGTVVPPYAGVSSVVDAEADRGGPTEANRAWRRQHLENAVVGEGSVVLSRDGEQVGELHRLVFDADSGDVAGLVVRQGWLFTEEVELPAALIAGVDDGVISLSVDTADLIARGRRVTA